MCAAAVIGGVLAESRFFLDIQRPLDPGGDVVGLLETLDGLPDRVIIHGAGVPFEFMKILFPFEHNRTGLSRILPFPVRVLSAIRPVKHRILFQSDVVNISGLIAVFIDKIQPHMFITGGVAAPVFRA